VDQGGTLQNSFVEMIREKIAVGLLPQEDPLKLWAGAGSGKPCFACETPILQSQTEYELLYYDKRDPLLLHIECHGVWKTERFRRRLWRRRP